jgi:hypothetical protein
VTAVFERTIPFVRTEFFWAITQQVLVIPCDISGQPIGPIFRGKESKMGPTGRTEKSEVRNYHSTLSSDPEERGSHPVRGGSLKSQVILCFNLHAKYRIVVQNIRSQRLNWNSVDMM